MPVVALLPQRRLSQGATQSTYIYIYVLDVVPCIVRLRATSKLSKSGKEGSCPCGAVQGRLGHKFHCARAATAAVCTDDAV